MRIKMTYADQADIPEGFAALYTEVDGKWVLTNVDGMRTNVDFEKVNKALTDERNAHKETKKKVAAFDGMDADEVQAKLDRVEELEAAAAGKLDETKINEIVETRVKSRVAPIQRELDNTKKALAEKDEVVNTLTAKEKTRLIHDAVRNEAVKLKVTDTAMEDILMLGERIFEVTEDGRVITKDNAGTTPGVQADIWLTDMQEKRPHWWPASQGGGSKGSGGGGGMSNNPWSADSWNMTEQSAYYMKHGAEKAEQMAKAAGTKVGGQRPSAKK